MDWLSRCRFLTTLCSRHRPCPAGRRSRPSVRRSPTGRRGLIPAAPAFTATGVAWAASLMKIRLPTAGLTIEGPVSTLCCSSRSAWYGRGPRESGRWPKASVLQDRSFRENAPDGSVRPTAAAWSAWTPWPIHHEIVLMRAAKDLLGRLRFLLHDEARTLKKLIERDDFWPPSVLSIEFKRAEFGLIHAIGRLKLRERTDHQARAGLELNRFSPSGFLTRPAEKASGQGFQQRLERSPELGTPLRQALRTETTHQGGRASPRSKACRGV